MLSTFFSVIIITSFPFSLNLCVASSLPPFTHRHLRHQGPILSISHLSPLMMTTFIFTWLDTRQFSVQKDISQRCKKKKTHKISCRRLSHTFLMNPTLQTVWRNLTAYTVDSILYSRQDADFSKTQILYYTEGVYTEDPGPFRWEEVEHEFPAVLPYLLVQMIPCHSRRFSLMLIYTIYEIYMYT